MRSEGAVNKGNLRPQIPLLKSHPFPLSNCVFTEISFAFPFNPQMATFPDLQGNLSIEIFS